MIIQAGDGLDLGGSLCPKSTQLLPSRMHQLSCLEIPGYKSKGAISLDGFLSRWKEDTTPGDRQSGFTLVFG